MYNKISEKILRNNYFKIYQCDKYDPINIISLLLNNNFKIVNIKVSEDADLGFKNFEGNYTVDYFFESYNSFRIEDINDIMVNLEDGNRIIINHNSITLVSKENIEIDSYLGMNAPKL